MDETNEEQTIRPKRRRIYRKRTVFRSYPHPAIPVRGLWEQATDEEKHTARRQCMAILEYWLGKRSKQEIAGRLGVPSLRVWQMSQQALSGMLAAGELPLWLAVKWFAFVLVAITVIALEKKFAPLGPLLGELAESGGNDGLNARISAVLKPVYPIVLAIYAWSIIAAASGVTKITL